MNDSNGNVSVTETLKKSKEWTELAWAYGDLVIETKTNRTMGKIFTTDEVVGYSNTGRPFKSIFVSIDSKGRIHGYPTGRDFHGYPSRSAHAIRIQR